MADTTSFETTEITDARTTAGDEAAAKASEDAIQLAQAAAIDLSSPGKGKGAEVSAEAGQTYVLEGQVARYTQDAANLVIHWGDGGHTRIAEYFVFFGPGEPGGIAGVPYDSLVASIPDFDPAAFTPAAGVPTPAPAAGPPPAAGGAFNTVFNGEFGVEGIAIGGLLGETELQFTLLPINPEILPFFPPAALIAEEPGPCDRFPPCPDPEALKAAFLAGWQRGEGETIVLFGEGSSTAVGGDGDDTIIGDGRGNLLIGDEKLDDNEWYNQDDGGNDLLEGGDGRDILVGDFYDTSGNDLHVRVENFSEGSGQVFDSFNDMLVGGEGGDTLVGDVYYNTNSGDMTVELAVSNYDGDDNVFNAFSDFLEGGEGWDTLVGDVMWRGVGSTDQMSLELAVSNDDGHNNQFNAFNDILWGGDGGGFLVGDVFIKGLDTGSDVVSSDIRIDLEVSNYDGDGNEFNAFNDILIGGDGKDFMVGDVFIKINSEDWRTDSAWDLDLVVSNDSGDNNVFNAFNDHLCAYGGNDVMVGDVYFWDTDEYNEHNVEISLHVANESYDGKGYGYGEGADNNVFNVFNDTMAGGAGNDTIVGDVYIRGLGMTDRHISVDLEVSNSSGDGNTFNAFNDLIHGGNEPPEELVELETFSDKRYGGDDTMVGDVYLRDITLYGDASLDVELSVSNDYGDNNVFNAFNDLMIGGDGNDVGVGDVYLRDIEMSSGYFSVDLEVVNAGGDNNTFTAFEDILCGGAGQDVLVGDVYFRNVSITDVAVSVDLAVYNERGHGNEFNAFSDMLIGREGNDTMVGDVYMRDFENSSPTELNLEVSNYKGDGNEFNAFNDKLYGGDRDSCGEQILVGDVFIDRLGYDHTSDLSINMEVSNEKGDNNTFNAFNDTLIGGDGGSYDFGGETLLAGKFGFGGDTMVGDVFIIHDTDNTNDDYDVTMTVSNYKGDGNEFNAFNDTLRGGDGDDTLVGDVFFQQFGSSEGMNLSLDMAVSNYTCSWGGSTADNNAFNAFNDILIGGAGDATLVGDVYVEGMQADFAVSMTVSNEEGANNAFNAFNDILDASEGGVDGQAKIDEATAYIAGGFGEGCYEPEIWFPEGSTLVGDVFFDGSTGYNSIDLAVGNYGEGADNNSFKAFSDTLTGGVGDDTLVGDVLYRSGYDWESSPISLTVSNEYGDNNSFEAFNDILRGGAGVDTIVGDVFYDEGTGSVALIVSNDYGSNNSFDAFNDVLDAGGNGLDFSALFAAMEACEDDCDQTIASVNLDVRPHYIVPNPGSILVGDVFSLGVNGDVTMTVSNNDADHNNFKVFEDMLTGGIGDDTLVGDLKAVDWDDNDDHYVLEVENHYGNDNTFAAFGVELRGGAGDDMLVGDVLFEDYHYGGGWDSAGITLTVSNEGDGNNTFNAFNDILEGGDGDDDLIGDVAYLRSGFGEGGANINLTVNNRYNLANNNSFNAFNDVLMAAAGADLLVGDVSVDHWNGDGEPDVELTVVNGEETSSRKPDYNTFEAFNDTMYGGGGDDELVGDVRFHGYGEDDGENGIDLAAENWYGNDNTFETFNDNMFGGDGYDILVGDVVTEIDVPVSLRVSTVDGDDNIFMAFNDTMTGGADDDFMIGDVAMEDDDLSYEITADGDYDSVSAFNNYMEGNGGDDVLIGNALNVNGGISVNVDADEIDETVTAFGDTLLGGAGEDVLIGDFIALGTDDIDLYSILYGNFDPGSVGIDDAIGALYDGALSVTTSGIGGDDALFNDVIDGGADDDILWGQLGDDILTGGGGADIFFYANADNSGGGLDNLGDGHDTITDFDGDILGDNDIVDLDALFDLLIPGASTGDDRADLVKISVGSDAVLTINDGNAVDFSITFAGVDLGGDGTFGQFDAAALTALGINVGDES